ncbi:unnamed protein product [Adineta steineri]|uniref:CRIB domain-containing protein n=1 Tax=Adineta steineri TaxID=433720 RepID=A0A813PN74_9BILA|nr:unnamed protein product [Adineta steineri]CAF3491205.1 unnamed protein product [Adineta steineri]CAF3700134.1 unnamed protein product [Adineta steineri]
MCDNSRVPSYTNVSSRPCRIQYSRWSLDAPTTETSIGQPLSQPTAILSPSVYFPQTQQDNQVLIPNYVNYYPSPSSLSSHSSNHQRTKSTISHDSTSRNQSRFHVNDFRQRYDSKAVVGIVKPMVHQRSCTQLNNNTNNSETKIPEIMRYPYHCNSTRSLYPQMTPTSSSPSTAVSSIIYRSRLTPSSNNINSHPPIAPRRHSSISNSKCLSSYRSSRTTSTSSSVAIANELSSTISSYEHEKQQNNNKSIIDIKRLEMFYGSVGTLVKSACSTAHLYITTARQLAGFDDWSCQQRGVPVWIYNTGANLKRARQVRLLLAQHDSCFAIWSDLVSERAELRLPKDNYITCWLPESNLLTVFKFECDNACRLFFQHYYEILEYDRRIHLTNSSASPREKTIQQQQQRTNTTTTNSKDIPRRYSRLRTIANKQDKEQQQQQQFELRRCRSLSKIRTVKKSAISGPINFEHVNHLSLGCNQEQSLLGTATLRSLHASMSHLPCNGTLTDRFSKQSKKRASALFESRTTAV